MSANGSADLSTVLTVIEPFGPPDTEHLLQNQRTFQQLYCSATTTHRQAAFERPAFIVGRKGAGKTAFLIGSNLNDDTDVVAVRSRTVFTLVKELSTRWRDRQGILVADNLVFVWQSLLLHAAALGFLKVARPQDAPAVAAIDQYLRPILDGDGGADQEALLSAVARRIERDIEAGTAAADGQPTPNGVIAPQPSTAALLPLLRAALERRTRRMCVVIDNLEDLHQQVHELSPVLRGLFRLVTRMTDPTDRVDIPFPVQFAFPSELVHLLREITVNPEKDFRHRLVIKWTASELIALAGARLAQSLATNFTSDGLPPDVRRMMSADPDPDALLRRFLPERAIRNGLGSIEDPVGYLMRHTQLLPRHLIQLLNEVFSPMIREAGARRCTERELVLGIRRAEEIIRQGILASYSTDYPEFSIALDELQNRLGLQFDLSLLHETYNRASIRKKTAMDYDEFVAAAMDVGVFGILARSTDRYHVAEFSYTFSRTLRPVEGDDELCIHPLFVRLLNNEKGLARLRAAGALPTYPYGSIPGEESW